MSVSQWQLGMTNGALFGVPIPEEFEDIGEKLQLFVEQAVREAEENGMSKKGPEATPWLLQRVGELTAGKSLASSKHNSFVPSVFLICAKMSRS